MKKTMFITSVIMVVVMAIALTTSSLAWFTAGGSDTVTTNALTLSAATPTATGIQISSVSADEAFGNAIDLAAAPVGSMLPLVPIIGTSQTLATALGAESENVAAPAFVGNKVVYVQKDIDNDNDLDTVGYYGYDPDGTHEGISSQKYTNGYFVKDFWIRNIGTSGKKVTPSITIKYNDNETTATRGTNPIINVAILAKEDITDNSTDDATWNLVQLFSNEVASSNGRIQGTVYYTAATANLNDGAAVAGSVTSSSSVVALANSGSSKTAGLAAPTVAASGDTTYYPVQFRAIVWFDGDGLNNGNASTASLSIALEFDAE